MISIAELKPIIKALLKMIYSLPVIGVLMGVASVFALRYISHHKQLFIEKYRLSQLHCWCFILLSLYTAFAITGETYFLLEDKAWSISWIGVGVYIIFALLSFINYIALAEKLNTLAFTPKTLPSKKEVTQFYWLSVLIMIGIGSFYWILLYPGNTSYDSNDVWTMIISNNYTTHHTVLYPVTQAFLLSIINDVAFIIFIQVLTFAFIYSLWTTFFYKHGYSKKIVLLVFGLWYLHPFNGTTMVTMWKDIPYTQCLMLISYLLLQLYLKKELATNTLFLIFLGLTLAFGGMIRFNGLGVLLLSLFFLMIKSYQNKNLKTITIPVVSILCSLFLVNVILFKAFNFKDQIPIHKAGLIISPINTAYIYGVEDSLHPELLKQTKTMDDSIWKVGLHSVIPIFWSSRTPEQESNFIQIRDDLIKDTPTFLKNYFYTWIGTPSIHLRTRLNYISSTWSRTGVYGGMHPIGSYEFAPAKNKEKFWYNLLPTVTVSSIYIFPLWLTTIILLFVGIYWILYDNNKNKLLILMPWFANLGIMFFVSTANDVRYFWIALWMVPISLFLMNLKTQDNN